MLNTQTHTTVSSFNCALASTKSCIWLQTVNCSSAVIVPWHRERRKQQQTEENPSKLWSESSEVDVTLVLPETKNNQLHLGQRHRDDEGYNKTTCCRSQVSMNKYNPTYSNTFLSIYGILPSHFPLICLGHWSQTTCAHLHSQKTT